MQPVIFSRLLRPGLCSALWRVLERIRPYAESAALAVDPPMSPHPDLLTPHALNTLAGVLNQTARLVPELEAAVPAFVSALLELDADLVARFGQPSRISGPARISSTLSGAGFRPILTAEDLPKEGEPLPGNIICRPAPVPEPDPRPVAFFESIPGVNAQGQRFAEVLEHSAVVVCPWCSGRVDFDPQNVKDEAEPWLEPSRPAHLRAVARFLVHAGTDGILLSAGSFNAGALATELFTVARAREGSFEPRLSAPKEPG